MRVIRPPGAHMMITIILICPKNVERKKRRRKKKSWKKCPPGEQHLGSHDAPPSAVAAAAHLHFLSILTTLVPAFQLEHWMIFGLGDLSRRSDDTSPRGGCPSHSLDHHHDQSLNQPITSGLSLSFFSTSSSHSPFAPSSFSFSFTFFLSLLSAAFCSFLSKEKMAATDTQEASLGTSPPFSLHFVFPSVNENKISRGFPSLSLVPFCPSFESPAGMILRHRTSFQEPRRYLGR